MVLDREKEESPIVSQVNEEESIYILNSVRKKSKRKHGNSIDT
jgi:hypothetical protein